MMAALTFWPTRRRVHREGRSRAGGRRDRELEEAAGARGLDWQPALRRRARLAAAEARPDDAAQEYADALDLLDPDDPFLDRALTHQAYGQLLRARGEHRQAVPGAAHRPTRCSALLGPLPSWPGWTPTWPGRGIRPADQPGRSSLDLTDRERDVAVLVAKGMTNPEVAAQLYISRKAVEYHLGNIYGKLGIKSRRELRTAAF